MSNPLPFRASVAAGDLVVISGQVGIANDALVESEAGPQTCQALENLTSVVGANDPPTAQVVKTTVFLTTTDDSTAMNEKYVKVFAVDPPARSPIAVHQLPTGVVVEVETLAYQGSGA